MNDEKTNLLKQLDESRDEMWSVMDSLKPGSKVTDVWNKRDFFAHIAGWEAIVYEIFRDYTAGVPSKTYAYTSVDVTNHESVQVRQSQTEEGAKLECEIYRFAIKTLLQSIPAEGYNTSLRFPWGSETITSFIQGAVKHEYKHAEDIIRFTQSNTP